MSNEILVIWNVKSGKIHVHVHAPSDESQVDLIFNVSRARAMKRLGFSDKRRLGSGDEYHLTPKIVKDRADRYGVVCEDSEVSEVDSEAQVRGQDILEPYRFASETTTQTPLTTQITPYASLSEKLDYVLGVLRKHPNGVSECELTRITGFEENELGKILGSLTKC